MTYREYNNFLKGFENEKWLNTFSLKRGNRCGDMEVEPLSWEQKLMSFGRPCIVKECSWTNSILSTSSSLMIYWINSPFWIQRFFNCGKHFLPSDLCSKISTSFMSSRYRLSSEIWTFCSHKEQHIKWWNFHTSI